MDKEYFASINTVSRELGIPAHTLRYWEKQFPTVVRPVSGAGGRRYYRPETVARLRTIQDWLYNRGMTIAGVKKLIRGGDFLTDEIGQWSVHPQIDTPPVAPSKPSDFVSNDAPTIAPLDATKLELAIGLLTQARDLLN